MILRLACSLFLLIPLASVSQTVHVKDDRIAYEGKLDIAYPLSEVGNRIQQLSASSRHRFDSLVQEDNLVQTKGSFRLRTPHSLVRTVDYLMIIKQETNGYQYTIDSVTLTEKKRGQGTTKKNSKEILDDLEEFGLKGAHAETILNEIDMQLQQVLAWLNKK